MVKYYLRLGQIKQNSCSLPWNTRTNDTRTSNDCQALNESFIYLQGNLEHCSYEWSHSRLRSRSELNVESVPWLWLATFKEVNRLTRYFSDRCCLIQRSWQSRNQTTKNRIKWKRGLPWSIGRLSAGICEGSSFLSHGCSRTFVAHKRLLGSSDKRLSNMSRAPGGRLKHIIRSMIDWEMNLPREPVSQWSNMMSREAHIRIHRQVDKTGPNWSCWRTAALCDVLQLLLFIFSSKDRLSSEQFAKHASEVMVSVVECKNSPGTPHINRRSILPFTQQ